MKPTNELRVRKHWKLSFGLAMIVLVCLRTGSAQTTYTVTDLGTLGGTFSFGTAVNSRGEVSGKSSLPGDTETHPFLWKKGVMTDLGTFGGPSGEAGYINVATRLVGGADTANPDPLGENLCGNGTGMICHGFIWIRGVMTDVGTLGGNNSFAAGINVQSHVVGYADLSPNSTQSHAFLRKFGVMTDLGTLGGPNSGAFNINIRRQVIGFAQLPNVDPALGFEPFHATLWDKNGLATDLGTLTGKQSFALIINRWGQVAGLSTLAGETDVHAFLWQSGVMQDIGALPGDPDSLAFGLNDKGQVVGFSANFATGAQRAFLWQNGVMTDLNTLIPAASGWALYFAIDTNRKGQITGVGMAPNGEFHGFLLTPATSSTTASLTPVPQAREQSEAITRPKVAIPELPESVRKMLGWGKPGLGRFGMGGSKWPLGR